MEGVGDAAQYWCPVRRGCGVIHMTREELIAAMQATRAPKPIQVTTEKWGIVYVKPRTVEEVDADSQNDKGEDGENKKRRLARGAARVICDENGRRIFDPESEEDLSLIAEQPWSMLQSLLAAVNDDAEKKTPAATS